MKIVTQHTTYGQQEILATFDTSFLELQLQQGTVFDLDELSREFGRDLTWKELRVIGHCFLYVITDGQEAGYPDPNLASDFVEPESGKVH